MAGLLKYLKRTQKKDNLDTGTLPDPEGSLIKQGHSFPFYWEHKYPSAPSAIGSIKQKEMMRAIYFDNTSTSFLLEKSGRKQHNCHAMLLF